MKAILALLVAAIVFAPGLASAALSVATGNFGIGTGAVSSTVSVTGLAFQPSALILFWNGRTSSTDAVGADNVRLGFGFICGSTNRRSFSIFIDNSNDPTDTGQGSEADQAVIVLGSAAGYDGTADFTSFNADGFTLTITDQFTASFRINYIALGGTDITNCTTGARMSGTTTGSVDVTGVGFEPDTVLIATNSKTSTGDGIGAGASFFVGAAAGAALSNATCGIHSTDNVASADSFRYCRSGDALFATNTIGTPVSRASVTAWLSDGYRLNYTTASSSRATYWMALAGANFLIGDLLTQTDTVTDIVESGFGFAPSAVMVLSHGTSASSAGTMQSHGELSIGAGTGAATRLAVAGLDEDGTGTTESATASEFDAIYANISTSDAIEGLMDIKSVDADGYTFIMDDADPAQSYAYYWAIGPATAAGGGQPPRSMHQFRMRRH